MHDCKKIGGNPFKRLFIPRKRRAKLTSGLLIVKILSVGHIGADIKSLTA